MQNGRAKVPGLLSIGGDLMRKAAKEGRLKVEDCKLQVEKSGASAGKQPSTLPTWLLAALLALATIALYWPAMRCDFINFDDPECVTANVHVQNGLTPGGIQWAFSHLVSSNWHPVTMLSHMLDCQLFGLEPWGHHLTSLLLHALNTALVFLLLRGMTGALWRSALAAALFGFHPLHVESVAWVSERKDVLSGFFGFLSLLFYARYARGAETGIQNPESRIQKSEIGGRRPEVGGESAFLLLLVCAAVLCAGLDEQADAGDVAVCDAAAGLVAAQSNAERGVRSAEFHKVGRGKDSVLCAGGGGQRCDLRGAESRR